MSQRYDHLPQISTLLFFFFFFLCLSASSSSANSHQKTHHFILIHGSCHGAWSWYKLVALLKSCGHRVTAIDLAASGIDSRQAKDLTSVAEYHQPLMEFMEEEEAVPSDQKVVLVGHSLGGMAVCQAMEMFPEKISVADRALATTLMRPVKLFADEDLSEVIVLTAERYGSVRRVFIVSEKDQVSEKEFQLWMIERNPPDDVVEVLGSDHMVMVSKPKILLAHLLEIAEGSLAHGPFDHETA
ncbi:Methylesterase 8 [Linum perenne]